jgi:hypothetical protein
MNNTVEICIKHGYSVNFYKLKDEVFVEVINREGVIAIEINTRNKGSITNSNELIHRTHGEGGKTE